MKDDLFIKHPPFFSSRKEEEPGPIRAFFQSLASRFDLFQIIPAALLLSIGILFIYGTGQQVGGYASIFWQKQLLHLGIGVCIWLCLIFCDYRWFGPASILIYLITIFLLVYVLFGGVERFNARRWFSFAGLSIQPSEFGKLAVILTVSWVLSFSKANINKPLWSMIVLLLTAVPFVLIYKEPDLGTALVLLPIIGAIAFAAKLKLRYIIILLTIAMAVTPLTYHYALKPYQKERIQTFLDPERDPLNRGYNAIQAEITVGSGGVAGKGFMNGTHCMLGYLPKTVANSDFIFPVIAEETGFLGSLFILLLYGALLFSILRTALLAEDPFGQYLCVGIGALLTAHTVVNIGMCIRLLPITGLPLPLISYGGTFLIAMMTYLGIVQSVYAHRNKENDLFL